jgi:ribokinase
MDLVVQVNRWPEPDETVTGRTYRSVPGGKGGNQAIAAARQGASVAMVGAVGKDDFGTTLVRSLQDAGVNVEGVESSGRTSGVALIGIAPDGQSRIIVVPGANRTLTIRHMEEQRERMAASDLVLLQLEIPMEVNIAAAAQAHRLGKQVILTPSPTPSYPLPDELLEQVDILVPNQLEARRLTGRGEPLEAATALQRRGIPTVIVTRGSEGALLVDEGGPRDIAPFLVEVVDTTGAGDAFVGALAAALARGCSIDLAARYASAAGALAVTRVGAQPSLPTLEAVQGLIDATDGNTPATYPDDLTTTIQSEHGEHFMLRPILPADAPRLQRAFEELSPESIYRRFFSHRRNLSNEEALSFATVDYHNTFALVATPEAELERLVAVARFAPTDARAGAVEMAIVVIDSFQGHGLGRHTFARLVEIARSRGHRWMLVETQPDNFRMIELAERAGCRVQTLRDSGVLQLWLALQEPVAPEAVA